METKESCRNEREYQRKQQDKFIIIYFIFCVIFIHYCDINKYRAKKIRNESKRREAIKEVEEMKLPFRLLFSSFVSFSVFFILENRSCEKYNQYFDAKTKNRRG